MRLNKYMKIYKDLLSALESGEKAVMVTALQKGANKNKFICTERDLYNGSIFEAIKDAARDSLKCGTPIYVSEDTSYLIEPYFPRPHLIIFGGGHIALPLANLGLMAGFSVTVIDDRPSFANSKRFPMAEKVICASFDECFKSIDLNKSSFAVIITRGHRYDMECLRNVLKYNTAYTGMIGSKRRVKMVMEQLLSEGYDEEKLKAVNAPIGLDIGAITPEELAISIISQIISCRRLANPKSMGFDSDVLRNLSSEDDSPRAIVTVVSTKGSTPRKPGAKMIVWPYGKIMGSIGGGCGEAEAVSAARDVIRDGGYAFKSIDLTADEAEEEGMVCGGIMDVVIESV